MSDQVGFSFQADVVNTASLGHVLTGRLLKALSDGGVDTYAMWAAVQLGKRIPIQALQQSSLHAHIMSKKTYQSVLFKALSIGWGHSAPVADLARTVAGANAIILIGALGTGSQAFAAAQCLSEVMAIFGLEIDTLPSVDVLKGLVNYLAPFTQDLGFAKVVHHITNAAERVMRHTVGNDGLLSLQRADALVQRLKSLGSAASLAGAIKQLIHTSQRNEKDYMALKTRGSWLPAFASHILGMSVEVRFNRTTVWASGGDHGHCLFQLDDESTVPPALHPFSQADGHIVRVKEDFKGVSDRSFLIVDYLLGEALEAQFLKRPEIDNEIAASIRVGIRCLSLDILSRIRLDHHYTRVNCVNGLFDGVRALKGVLNTMGIDVNSHQQVPPGQEKYLGPPPRSVSEGIEYQGLWFLDPKALNILADSCPSHQRDGDFKGREFEWTASPLCVCRVVGRLIHCTAATAIALMFCNFDAAEVRVQEKVMAGDLITNWSEILVSNLHRKEVYMSEQEGRKTTIRVEHHDLFYHLGELVCCDYELHWFEKADASSRIRGMNTILGVSGRAFTIDYKCVMENECFDECGRFIRLQPGRASVAGTFRNVIVEETLRVGSPMNETAEGISLAGKTTLEPSHRPPETRITMDVSVHETAIFVRLNLTGNTSRSVTASLTFCVDHIFSQWAVPRCNHDKDGSYTLLHDQDVVLNGFHIAKLRRREATEVLVYALRGNQLEQLLVCGLMSSEVARWASEAVFPAWPKTAELGVLQASACLKCCIDLARQPGHLPCVVMGN